MITCTTCGQKNDDLARYCFQCGRKLQSERRHGSDSNGFRFLDEEIPRRFGELFDDGFRKYVEAWLYLLALFATAVACMWENSYLPLYITAPLIALLAWARKI